MYNVFQRPDNKKKRGEGIVKMSDLFLKYQKILKAPQGTVVQAAIDTIHEMYGITLKKEQCTYQVHSKTLSVQVGGPFKSEIILNKKEILERIGKRIGVESAPKQIL